MLLGLSSHPYHNRVLSCLVAEGAGAVRVWAPVLDSSFVPMSTYSCNQVQVTYNHLRCKELARKTKNIIKKSCRTEVQVRTFKHLINHKYLHNQEVNEYICMYVCIMPSHLLHLVFSISQIFSFLSEILLASLNPVCYLIRYIS